MSDVGPSTQRSRNATQLLIPHFASLVQSPDTAGWLPATMLFCDLLSGTDPPIEAVLNNMVVPALLLFLANEANPELQLESAKALVYLASGTSVADKVDLAPDPVHVALVSLLKSKDERVLAHACCSLSVLSGCINGQVRNLIRDHHLFPHILQLTRYPTLVADALHTIGNIMEGNPELIHFCISDGQILDKLRIWLADVRVKVRKEACWIVCYITADVGRWIQAVCDTGLIESMANVVLKDELVAMEAAVRAISNATFGATVEQIRFMVDKGCVEALCYLFCCRFPKIFKVCLDGLENILKAGEEMINGAEVVDNPYAKHVEKMHGWTVLENIGHLYDQELCERALNLLGAYGPMSSSEREQIQAPAAGNRPPLQDSNREFSNREVERATGLMDEIDNLRDRVKDALHDPDLSRGLQQRDLACVADKPGRTVVEFRKLPRPNTRQKRKKNVNDRDVFFLELGHGDMYYDVVGRLSAILHVDYTRIRLADCRSKMIHPPFARLLDLLRTTNKICNVLYYKVLPGLPKHDLPKHELLDIVDDIEARYRHENQLREEIIEEFKLNFRRYRVDLYHFTRTDGGEVSKKLFITVAYRANETLADIKERLHSQLGIDKEEISKRKFAVLRSRGQPKYLEDTKVVYDCVKDFKKEYLGLEGHIDGMLRTINSTLE